MPLTSGDRQFLHVIDRLKVYLLLVAVGVLVLLLVMPQHEVQFATSVIGVVLCGIFWLTQRLLSYITVLDLELSRVVETLKRILPEEQRRELTQGRR